jgi:type I restriction enzyme S subunit
VRAQTEFKRLEDLCELFADGDWIETKDQSPSGIRLIQTGNIGIGEFKDRAEKGRFVSESTFKRLRCTEIFEGDCLVSRLPDPVGRSCLLPATEERMITAVDCTIIRFKRDLLEPKYFHYFTQSDEYFRQIERLTTGATRQRISRSNLGGIVIPLPPLPEQQRIVAILDEAFAGVATATANAEKNLRNARELFESRLQSVFMNSTAGWKQCTLEQVCSFSSGGTPPKGNASYWKGNIPWVSGRDMKTDRLSDAALHISQAAVNDSATRIAPVGSLLILVRGMGLANGVAVAEVMSPCAFNQDIKAIHPNSEIDPRFLLLSLRCAFAKSNKLLSNAAHGTLKIEMDELREVRLLVPPRKIQEGIASHIDSLSFETQRLVSVYKDKLARLAALKQSILQKAFSGELTSPPSQAIKEAAE